MLTTLAHDSSNSSCVPVLLPRTARPLARRRTSSVILLYQFLLLPGVLPLARPHKASGGGGAPGVDHTLHEVSPCLLI